MRKIRTITEEQLDQMPKEMIAAMYVQLSSAMEAMVAQNDQMLKQIESLKEQIAVLTQQLFGRKKASSEVTSLKDCFRTAY